MGGHFNLLVYLDGLHCFNDGLSWGLGLLLHLLVLELLLDGRRRGARARLVVVVHDDLGEGEVHRGLAALGRGAVIGSTTTSFALDWLQPMVC